MSLPPSPDFPCPSLCPSPPSYLLVSHGSRDPRASLALEKLVTDIQGLVPHAKIFAGVLEFGDRSLHDQIRAIVEAAAWATPGNSPGDPLGDRTGDKPSDRPLRILPLFLQPGSHVLEDLPAEIQAYRQGGRSLGQVQLMPYLGSALLATLKTFCTEPQTWIVLAHGSAHPQTQTFFTHLHQTLGTHPAYWQHPPHLEDTVDSLVKRGITEIGVLPYFLFPGKITDSLAQALQNLKKQYPHLKFSDRPLLAQQPGFAALIANLLRVSTEFEP